MRAPRAWRWFDELTGLSRGLGPILRHPVPPAGRSAWLYVLGSATLVAFLLQVVTGTALATGYVTSSGDAYDSLRFISGTAVGRVVRGAHAYGASAMVILIGAHAIRVYLMGAYKYPRQVNWLSGAALLLLTLGMAFTGQLLRWDQTGYWTAVIAAEQAGRTPALGDWIGHFVLAGSTVGGATLSRFFATHVFFIPGLVYLAVALHLYLVLHNGISEPPVLGRPVEPATYRAWYREHLEREGRPFWPEAAWRDAVFAMLVVAVVLGVAAALGPPELGRPPDPTLIDASPRPDWYFLWYFAVLSVIPKWSEDVVIVLGPLLLVVFLVALPLVAGRGERHPLARPWAIAGVAAVVVLVWHESRVGAVAPWSPRFDARPLPADVVGATEGPIATGARVFYDRGCLYCHLVSGRGGIRGPDLSTVGDRLSREQLLTRIYSGAANMPSYVTKLRGQELESLLAFLASRQRNAP
ncbi:menaquinol-cytochrome c reductase cytochrome b/c subunit [Anaeromyxobacter oryzisoli]|uniref:menaquinol-cytochrome c reductase cytochrome b/c subunit n=1 Tax=Anaeromyxobacter oryzisoli TaxID=2925408 RepID=UPI001F5A1A43|nr:menaquinol-cytochrome c reductase cytochrome b/c subunit [Anaeromyxobacter sp. SG63]